MARKLKQSLIDRAGIALSLVILLAVVNMLVSYLIAESSENDGARMNLAGSLRMQSYRIAMLVVMERSDRHIGQEEPVIEEEIKALESILNRPVLSNHIHSSGSQSLQHSFLAVEDGWNKLKPRISTANNNRLFEETSEFVSTIDILVKALEMQTEDKFKMLRLMQGIFLLISVCIVLPAFYQIYYRVVGPMRAMVEIASEVRKGNFSNRLNSKGDDELAQLAETFNEMIDSLDTMYFDLESKVEEKTLHLENVQQGLRLLYQTSRRLSSDGDFVNMLEITIRNLRQYLDVSQIDIQVNENAGIYLATISTDSIVVQNIDSSDKKEWVTKEFPLSRGDEHYGVLVVSQRENVRLNEEQEEIMVAVLDTISSAISHEVKNDQRHRLALIEERSAIARELHDSLAQSLSYTKIQVSRFRMLQKQAAEPRELDDALKDISTGINSAYQQLREILATFRLQLNSGGLQSSLEMTVTEYEEKSDLKIGLSYELHNFSLSPNEEIHVLQIVREALSNVVRHSGAEHVKISIQADKDAKVQVSISDDGCGFKNENAGPNHYGKTIMNERSNILGGVINFSDKSDGGAEVVLAFRSERAPG